MAKTVTHCLLILLFLTTSILGFEELQDLEEEDGAITIVRTIDNKDTADEMINKREDSGEECADKYSVGFCKMYKDKCTSKVKKELDAMKRICKKTCGFCQMKCKRDSVSCYKKLDVSTSCFKKNPSNNEYQHDQPTDIGSKCMEYCGLCQTDRSGFTKEMVRQKCLEDHNRYRRVHETRNDNNSKKRTQLNDLEYDLELEKRAQAYADVLADTGVFEHDKQKQDGENLAEVESPQHFPELKTDVFACKKAHKLFYREIIDMGPPKKWNWINVRGGKGYREKDEWKNDAKTVGHYTQMMWSESRKVGYGFSFRKEEGKLLYIVVIRYSPPGNVAGEYQKHVGPCKGYNKDEELNCWP